MVKFLILVVLIGIPWCFMEIAVGQYSGRGPTAIGDMVPIGKGAENPAVGLCPVFLSSRLFLFFVYCFYILSLSLHNNTQLFPSHRVHVSVRFVLSRRSGGHGLHLFFKRYLL